MRSWALHNYGGHVPRAALQVYAYASWVSFYAVARVDVVC